MILARLGDYGGVGRYLSGPARADEKSFVAVTGPETDYSRVSVEREPSAPELLAVAERVVAEVVEVTRDFGDTRDQVLVVVDECLSHCVMFAC